MRDGVGLGKTTPPERGGMARIYVSSTYGELKDHRDNVYRALRQLDHDVIAMEDHVAADRGGWDRAALETEPARWTAGRHHAV